VFKAQTGPTIRNALVRNQAFAATSSGFGLPSDCESASAFHWKGQQITAMVGYFAMVCWVMNVARTPGFGGSGATPLTAFPGWMCRLSHAVSIRMYRPAAYARHRWHTTVLTQPQQQLTNVNLPSPFGRASPSHGFRCNSTRDFSGPRRTA
jgi:hypothetical protein